ncbi:MAG: hypothetical protein JWN07_1016 [Hyphomicrobiales bacterium]|nr:hypothetical protein [Hyphomicrobiales bacterium]
MEQPTTRFQDWTNLAVGFGLAIYPWVIGYSDNAVATRVSVIAGALIFLVAGAALVRFAEWEEWLNMLLGIGVAASPFFFGLTGSEMATQALFLAGVIVTAMAGWEIWAVHHPEPPEPLPH